MMASKKNHTIWFFVYFLLLAGVGAFIRDIPGQPELLATIENFMQPVSVTKLGDPQYFALGAMDIYRHGWIQPENHWLIRLWPPGFMVTEGVLLKIFGLKAPFILLLVILNALLAAVLLSLLRDVLLGVLPPHLANLVPLVPFIFSVTRLFLLQPGGIILGESFSIILFLISIVLLVMAARSGSSKLASLAGLTFALAAYFRSQFELVVLFLTAATIFAFCLYFIFLKRRLGIEERIHLQSAFRTMAVMLLASHILMLPWRIYNFSDPGLKKMSWVQTQSLVFTNAGRTNADLIAAGGGWIVSGGGNAACNIEPSYCGKSDQAEFYRVLASHPVEWIRYKYKLLPDYWMSSSRNYTLVAYATTPAETFENIILFLMMAANLVLLMKIRRHEYFVIYFLMCAAFYACNAAIFLLVHFEVRYLYALKIFSSTLFCILAAVAWAPGIYGKNRLALENEK